MTRSLARLEGDGGGVREMSSQSSSLLLRGGLHGFPMTGAVSRTGLHMVCSRSINCRKLADRREKNCVPFGVAKEKIPGPEEHLRPASSVNVSGDEPYRRMSRKFQVKTGTTEDGDRRSIALSVNLRYNSWKSLSVLTGDAMT